jgi:hypothetical protein
VLLDNGSYETLTSANFVVTANGSTTITLTASRPIVGIGDDQGFGWAIAKALAEAVKLPVMTVDVGGGVKTKNVAGSGVTGVLFPAETCTEPVAAQPPEEVAVRV